MRLRTVLLLTIASTAFAANETHWVATWGSSPAPQLTDDAQMRAAKLVFDNQTIREFRPRIHDLAMEALGVTA